MRLTEIEQKAKIPRNWIAAQTDAEARGLMLTQNSYAKNWRIEPANYPEISKELQSRGFKWSEYSMLTQNIKNIRDYPKAAEEVEKHLGDLPKIIQTIIDARRERAFRELTEMQRDSLTRSPHGHQQLFLPRPKINTIKPRWYYTRYAYDDQGNPLTESRPILSPTITDPGSGGNKPKNSFWTSSLKKEFTENGITYWGSEWVDFVCGNNVPKESYSPVGYVYNIKPNARILTLIDDSDVNRIYELYRDLGVNLNPNAEWWGKMTLDFPWNELIKHWDGMHHHRGYGDQSGFMYGYDVESTVWFNPSVLEYAGKVRIRPYDYHQDDDKNNY